MAYHDPFVRSVRVGGLELSSVPLSAETLSRQDCVALLTAHSDIDVSSLVNHSAMLFDARGTTSGIEAPNVIRL